MDPRRAKAPLDGPGPRGAPDCYYTSRVLNSTFRYEKFVRKLRAFEEDQRKGNENKLQAFKDQQYSDFFISCDRKLKELYTREEEVNIREVVKQGQAGREAAWQEKKERLAYLLAKRQKEHEEKYKETPLSKCVHVMPCLVKLRAKEAQEIQLYQMKEKAARREAEKELDKMWHDIAMKEADALAARMEYDEIQRAKQDMDCFHHSKNHMEQNKIRQQQEKERLKQESLYFRGLWDKAIKDEEEAERRRLEARHKTTLDRAQALEERKLTVQKQAEEQQVIQEAWASLGEQGLAKDKAKEELRRRKERELNLCNRKMIELRNDIRAADDANDDLVRQELQKHQQVLDESRCKYLLWSQNTNREVRKAMIDQIHDRKQAREELKKKLLEQDEYHRQLFEQLTQLSAYKDLTDAQARKKHQENLLKQIEYNKLLKERALQEEMEQRKKGQRAADEYNAEINRMLCRPFHSDIQHPFMRQMAGGLKMRQKCPCSRPDYCADPTHQPK